MGSLLVSPGLRAGCGLKLNPNCTCTPDESRVTRPSGRVWIETRVLKRSDGQFICVTRPSGRVWIETC